MAKKLNETLKEQIEISEKGIEVIKTDISKARAIGMDVSDMLREVESQEKQIKLIKSVYGL